MMDISHLSHDASFGDPILQLDVKEQIKTREVNAREERNLQRRNEGYERSKFIFEKETAWEQRKVGQSLHEICERSPQMEKCLAMEKARIEAIKLGILNGNHRTNSKKSDTPFTSYRSLTSISLQPLHGQDEKHRVKHSKTKDNAKHPSDGNNNSINPERDSSRQANFVRRSERSIRALAELNWKQQNRRRDHEKFKEELLSNSKSVIEEAKVVLRGRSDIDVENLFENILLPPVRKPANLNNSYKPFSRHKGPSDVSERSVLRLMDSVEPKPHPPTLASMVKKSEAEGKDTPKVESKLNKSSKVVSFTPVSTKKIERSKYRERIEKTHYHSK